jgi:putative acetyltransferase
MSVIERDDLRTRAVTDADADALTALIGAAYDEHPGCVLDLPGVDDDLPTPATAAARRGGRWWVVVDGEDVVASVGTGPVTEDGSLELKRLYVTPTHRGRGVATALVRRVEAHAAGLGATSVMLWSDTRFDDAHHLYARCGYADTGERRQLHDPSDTTEIRFHRHFDAIPARRRVTWSGPFGVEVCELVELPDGTALRGRIEREELTYTIEVDRAWRTRTATVLDPGGTRRLATDGMGRWWERGRELPALAGCTAVDIEATPVTNTLPIRQLEAEGRHDAELEAAWVRVPGPAVVPGTQRYRRLGPGRWRYASGTFEAELSVDDDGLVITYGDLWRRR